LPPSKQRDNPSERGRTLPGLPRRYGHGRRPDTRWPWPTHELPESVPCQDGWWIPLPTSVLAVTYAERLFKFPAIDNLPPDDARAALSRPAQDEGVEFTAEALDEAVTITGGYPYFIQELGYAVWTVADGPVINLDDVQAAVPAYEAKLDTSFFRVRLDRATDLQRAYLRAMAQLGPTAQKASDVAEVMGRSSTNLGPTRAELINMGLLYTPEHGYASFTVPHFDRFMLRAVPALVVPELRNRRRR